VVSIGKPDAFQVGTSWRRRLAGIARHRPLSSGWASSSPGLHRVRAERSGRVQHGSRLLIVHRYAPGIRKSGSAPCAVEHVGQRGKPVKKMRLIPAEKTFAFARKLQGAPGCTVSVC
jgi:hypothetical protein